jgi:hypothetical protein
MAEESKTNIPEEFVCALTKEIMKEPMISRYGIHYEYDAIMDWLQKGNQYCPVTGKRTFICVFVEGYGHRSSNSLMHT